MKLIAGGANVLFVPQGFSLCCKKKYYNYMEEDDWMEPHGSSLTAIKSAWILFTSRA